MHTPATQPYLPFLIYQETPAVVPIEPLLLHCLILEKLIIQKNSHVRWNPSVVSTQCMALLGRLVAITASKNSRSKNTTPPTLFTISPNRCHHVTPLKIQRILSSLIAKISNHAKLSFVIDHRYLRQQESTEWGRTSDAKKCSLLMGKWSKTQEHLGMRPGWMMICLELGGARR